MAPEIVHIVPLALPLGMHSYNSKAGTTRLKSLDLKWPTPSAVERLCSVSVVSVHNLSEAKV